MNIQQMIPLVYAFLELLPKSIHECVTIKQNKKLLEIYLF